MIKHKYRAINCCRLIVIFLNVSFCACVFGDEVAIGYQAEGSVSFSGKPLKEPYAGTFIMQVIGCKWKIRIKRSEQNSPDYTEIGWDGTNLFSVTSMESNYKKLQNEGKTIRNVATAYIGNDEIYRSVFDPELAMVWLTFGSRCYFDSKKQGDLLEPVITYDRRGAIEWRKEIPLYRARWVRQTHFPFLPTAVFYIEDLGSKTFTNSAFRVSSFLSFENRQYPKTSTLETFQFMEQSNSITPQLKLFSKYELSLTTIHDITASDFSARPILPGPTDFVDDRIPTVGEVSYGSSNWVAEPQLTNSVGFRKSVSRKKSVEDFHVILEKDIARKRIFIMLILAMVFCIPLIVFLQKYANQNKK